MAAEASTSKAPHHLFEQHPVNDTLRNMPPISTAILGTGMALNHLHFPLVNALPDLYQLTTVLERTDRGIARKVCGPNIKVVSTLAEVLGDATLELVIVATADKTHFEIIKQCLLAKKHGEIFQEPGQSHGSPQAFTVFTDKPLTYSSAEAEELGKLAKKQNVTLSVFQNRRWDGDFLTAAKLIKSGKVRMIPSR
jgi:predicted dehydrogenase